MLLKVVSVESTYLVRDQLCLKEQEFVQVFLGRTSIRP